MAFQSQRQQALNRTERQWTLPVINTAQQSAIPPTNTIVTTILAKYLQIQQLPQQKVLIAHCALVCSISYINNTRPVTFLSDFYRLTSKQYVSVSLEIQQGWAWGAVIWTSWAVPLVF